MVDCLPATPLYLNSVLAPQRGAHLDFSSMYRCVEFDEVLSSISTTHLFNLSSPTFVEYQFFRAPFRLAGPNGTFSFMNVRGPVDHVVALPLLPLPIFASFDSYRNNPLPIPRFSTHHPFPPSRHLPSTANPMCRTSSPLCSRTLHCLLH